LFCHSLVMDENNMIIDYKLRQKDPKRRTVQALQSLEYRVISFGDSYNDISMLSQADAGMLFNPPDNVIKDHPEFPVTHNYEELKKLLVQYI